LTICEVVRETKVSDDDVAIPVQQEILQFQIAVNNLLLVQVVDTRDELSKESAGITVLEVLVCQDVIEELTACGWEGRREM
jgi:hypothetical protein